VYNPIHPTLPAGATGCWAALSHCTTTKVAAPQRRILIGSA
jgi:hypothetical protein